MVTMSPSEVFIGPIAALPATVFFSIIIIVVYNFRFVRGSGLYIFLRFRFLVLNIHSILRVYFIL